MTTKKHLENRSGEGNVDSGLQVYLEEDGSRQHKTELGEDERSVAYAPRGATKHKRIELT